MPIFGCRFHISQAFSFQLRMNNDGLTLTLFMRDGSLNGQRAKRTAKEQIPMNAMRSFFLLMVPIACGCGETATPSLRLQHLAFSGGGKWLAAGGGAVRSRGGDGILKVWTV